MGIMESESRLMFGWVGEECHEIIKYLYPNDNDQVMIYIENIEKHYEDNDDINIDLVLDAEKKLDEILAEKNLGYQIFQSCTQDGDNSKEYALYFKCFDLLNRFGSSKDCEVKISAITMEEINHCNALYDKLCTNHIELKQMDAPKIYSLHGQIYMW